MVNAPVTQTSSLAKGRGCSLIKARDQGIKISAFMFMSVAALPCYDKRCHMKVRSWKLSLALKAFIKKARAADV